MKKFIKLLLLLLVSFSVDSKNTCKDTCPLKVKEAKLRSAVNNKFVADENDWILNTRFKY